jgi:hypothetical protein
MNRIPMVALNIDTSLRRAVAKKGLSGVPENEREGITAPAAPSSAYLDYLLPIYAEHERDGKKKGEALKDDPDFRRFVEAQQLWDRAMAQAIHSAADRPEKPLVVGIMGSGHIKHGRRTPSIEGPRLPRSVPCRPDPGRPVGNWLAEQLTRSSAAPGGGAMNELPRQRPGIRLKWCRMAAPACWRGEKGSIAEAAGIRDNDLISEAAGTQLKRLDDITGIVKRQAPGTWLPLKLKRDGDIIELIAKFPAVHK